VIVVSTTTITINTILTLTLPPRPQACPLFGKLSDVLGRRTGLFLTVFGTILPLAALAVTRSMWIYVVAQGLSGLFASTFTIAFAYIADVVAKVRHLLMMHSE
jgi:MFS family permease